MMLDLALHVRDQAGIDKEIVVRRPYAIVGSGQDSDVRIPDMDLTKPRRLYFQAVDEGILAVRLSSPRQTKKGAPAAAHLLGNRERLKVGPYTVAAELRSPHADTAARYQRDFSIRRLPNQPNTNLCLRFVNGHTRTGRVSARYLRDTMTLIGSSSRSHLKLSHPDVPDFHSSIVRTGNEIWILALSRKCELQVNGHRVRHIKLVSGDILSIGPFLMQLQVDQHRDSSTVLIPRERAVRTIPPADASSGLPDSVQLPDSTDLIATSSSPLATGEKPGGSLIPHQSGILDSDSASKVAETGFEQQDNSGEQDAISCSSNTDVVELVEQLTGLQQMLIEQSQLQTSLMIQLAAGAQTNQRSQEDLLREQIAAIQSIAGELQAWRSDLEKRVESAAGAPLPLGPPLLPGVPPRNLTQDGPFDPAELPHLAREPKSQEDIEAHSSLSERIEFLEQERNSIIQRIVRLLPNSRDSTR